MPLRIYRDIMVKGQIYGIWNLSNIKQERATFETCYSQCTETEAEALTLSPTPFQAVHE